MTIRNMAMMALIALIWIGSLALTYMQTREKWYALGTSSGENWGRAAVIQDLCSIGQAGTPEGPVALALGVKSMFADITGVNGSLTIYCS